jgi:formiminotetrahydrofolate cyclodeaminase
MLAEMTIKEFLEKTASNAPVPGGGSVAALSASLSAALAEMVANLTIGKKKYYDVEAEMKELVEKFSELRNNYIEDIDRDANAFNEVMEAFKLPKDTEEQAETRKQAIQDALKKAALVPLEVARNAYNMMNLVEEIVEKGNKNAVTDGLVSVMMARTAVLSALYNVKINLDSIKDEEFVKEIEKEVKELETKAMELEKKILSKVDM